MTFVPSLFLSLSNSSHHPAYPEKEHGHGYDADAGRDQFFNNAIFISESAQQQWERARHTPTS
jgi:hypothetical protein